MSRRDQPVEEPGPGMELMPDKPVRVADLMLLRPSDVIQFSVYDHEETKLFGVMRDEMLERHTGEPQEVWEARCEDVREWNRRRSKAMTAVFLARVAIRYGVDNEAVQLMIAAYGMALEFGGAKALPYEHMVKLLTGGTDEGDSGQTDSQAGGEGREGLSP